MKRLLALCLLLALLLCACSAAGQPTQATQQPTEETAAAPTETAAAPKTFGLSYLPEHGFNPYTCTATVNRAAFSLLYESLFVVRRISAPSRCSVRASRPRRTGRPIAIPLFPA